MSCLCVDMPGGDPNPQKGTPPPPGEKKTDEKKARRGCCKKLADCTCCVFHCLCCLRKSREAFKNKALPWPCNCLWNWAQLGTTFAAIMLLLWLLYRPERFRPRVDSAVLSALDVVNANDNGATSYLRYDLAVDISFVNSHSRLSVSYLDVGANAFYGNSKLGPANDALPSFKQGPNNTTVLHPAFRGVSTVDSDVAATLQSELAAGTAVLVKVSVDLTLMTTKMWSKMLVYFYKYDCWLSFTPSRNAAAPPVFHGAGTLCLLVHN